jgi:hypothetical protein
MGFVRDCIGRAGLGTIPIVGSGRIPAHPEVILAVVNFLRYFRVADHTPIVESMSALV